ncbi:DUF3500 domain-containing protein [Flavilitoribacter nigricans]|uniref:DUF3500 domain-containing protein n=1 Tax=Flavilitoribacter nigricans (strain ATCC 23147 / DSM 23189 / NBRC 102662 / NCIMB 1420 / SS-2) TaxID=1122177 RepID=A0A2D0N183_FLAN2|nr:DUF3500 domain-containing protein [Flavilitoribacter nigricans]PHN02291.1 hypothetical protein CRP01_32855 [Flavilitoribacter nigricans DSM 23189 = NBRC 102662]
MKNNLKKLNGHKFYLLLVLSLLIGGLSACQETEIADDGGNTDDPVVVDCSTEGTVAISSTAVIQNLQQAILAFRNSLSESLLETGSTCLDDERVYLWHNTPANNNRDGITYGDLSDAQLVLFKTLLQQFLSDAGYQKVDEITTLAEGFLSEINSGMWHPDYYSIDMFGDPETSGSWGFQIDGHHCAITFLVHGDQISMVPAFLGGEPTTETYNGTSFDIFADERDLALALYNTLSTDELAAAVSTGSLGLKVGPASQNGNPDPYRGDYDYSGFATGLKYSEMTSTAQANLIALMQEYVYNLETTFADEWWSDVFANIEDTYFVWIDNVTTPSATTQFYYRIYNPYLWVEYNMENPVGQGIETWNHAHTITRIPNNPTDDAFGGDYGIFAQIINNGGTRTLFEHYALADHHKLSEIQFDYTVEGIGHTHDLHAHTHVH